MIILNISKYILIYKIYFDIFKISNLTLCLKQLNKLNISKNTKFVFMLYNL